MAETAPAAAPATPNPATNPATSAGKEPAAEPAVPAPPPKKYKVKVEDQETEVDETELVSGYQLKKASMKKFEEAAAVRKQVEGLLQYVKQNPFDPRLKQIFGEDWNPEALAEDMVIKKYEREKMSPEQQELADLREREKQRALAEEQAKKDQETQEFEKNVEIQRQKLISDFVPAIEKMGLPKNTESMRRMVHVLRMSNMNGIPLAPDQIAEQVHEDYANELRTYAGAKQGQSLLDILGPELRKAIRKAEVAAVRGGNLPNGGQEQPKPQIDPKLTGRAAYEARMQAMIKGAR